jgi:hypothetical protein
MFCVVQIKCSPIGPDLTPSPTTINVVERYANEKEARTKWHGDQVYEPKSDVPGQHVYLVLWNTAEPLNLHREVDNNNTLSNVGAWFDRVPAKPVPRVTPPGSTPTVRGVDPTHGQGRRTGTIPRRPGGHYRPPSAFHQP